MGATIPGRANQSADVDEFVEMVQSGAAPRGHSYVVLLGLDEFDPVKLIEAVERGIDVKSFTRFQRNVELPQSRLMTSCRSAAPRCQPIRKR